MKLAYLEGKTLAGRFRLESKLGSGGYGAVFEAVQLSVGRRCAVKVLFPHLCDDEATVQRFRTEARTTSRLTHPNSVIIYDFGRDEELDLLFLAMELLDGDDLRSVIRKRGWMGVDESVHVVSQAAESLQEAHDLGLVHRDIKPHNIMLLERGSDASFVKVIDFGIAKVVRNSLMTVSDVTQTGTIIGTPKYMSPEQIRDSGIDGRADMYGLAISAYQMLLGRTPFEEGTALEIAGRQIAEKPQPLRAFRPDLAVSEAFEKVLLKALAKKPDDRFATVAEFAKALEAAATVPAETSGQVTAPSEPANPPSSEPTALLDLEETGSQPRRAEIGLVEHYDEITQGPEVALYDGVAEPPRAETGESTGASGALESEEGTESIELGDDAEKTMATLAIANPARPDYETEHTRDGTTAEVVAEQEEEREAPQSGALSRVPVLISAVLVVLIGLGLWLVSAGFGESTAPAESEPKQAAMAADDPILTSSAHAEPTPAPKVEPEPDVKQEPEAEPEPEVESEPEPEVEPEPEPEVEPEPEAEPEAEPEPDPEVKAKAAPRPRQGSLEVRVIPWGTLYVDGRKVGEGTRHMLRLRVGRHRLVLKQSGEVRARRSVDVSSRSSKIIELVAK